MNRFPTTLPLTSVTAFATACVTFAVILALPGRAKAAPVPSIEVKEPESLTEINGYLLLNRKVLRDMKCDIDQLDKIFDIMEEAQAKGEQIMNQSIQGLIAQGGNFNQQAMQKLVMDTVEKAGKEMGKGVERVKKDLLTPAQRKRLQEIDLQERGYFALMVPAVAKVLELTPMQKKKLEDNAKKVSEELTQLAPPAIPGLPVLPKVNSPADVEKQQKVRKERDKIQAEGLKLAVDVLTDDQKAI